jgi:hypothetical protein
MAIRLPGNRPSEHASGGAEWGRPAIPRVYLLKGNCAGRERRWDEAAGLSLDVVAYIAPQEHPAVNAVALGSSGVPRSSLADYVMGTGAPRGATAVGKCLCWLSSYVRPGGANLSAVRQRQNTMESLTRADILGA